jgi:hypothetical protein
MSSAGINYLRYPYLMPDTDPNTLVAQIPEGRCGVDGRERAARGLRPGVDFGSAGPLLDATISVSFLTTS